MRISSVYPILGALLFAYAQAGAAQGASVKITAPGSGARIDAMDQAKVTYEVVPGPKGDHTHLYVDGREVAVLRQLKGSYELAPMAPGPHDICIKVVNKAHTPIGVEACVKVTVS
ncbi:hypothetical protein [Lacisediminimonas sp.]|uniref:hypothetical protein n=1 Tax=Lacisediminimonas sp. TaxID=3060582 RepID=UPI00271B9459|nr:hypothetical protein [Lacisediminimonas sp.]MDO8300695.1 hypothetical protein [Lacisediminimonas sp.]